MATGNHLFYLDHNKNVNVEDLGNRSRLCKVISELKPVRDVDWSTSREGHTTLSTNGQALAAHGQRCGDVMTHKEACQYCKAGFGAFQSCVVIWYDGPSSYMKGGSCMNCYFGGRWRGKCSLLPENQRVKADRHQGNDEGSTARLSYDPVQYLQAKKRKRSLEYDSTYYQSPLDQPNIKGKGKFGEKRQALESIHSVYERVVQDMDRLFKVLSEANELESGEDTEEDEEDPVVVGSDTDEEDTKETAVEAVEAVVTVEEIEKKHVKIAKSDLKKVEDEEQPTTSKKSRASRGKGKKSH